MHQPVDQEVPTVLVYGRVGGERCSVRVRFQPDGHRYTAEQYLDRAKAQARYHFWIHLGAARFVPFSLVEVTGATPYNLPR